MPPYLAAASSCSDSWPRPMAPRSSAPKPKDRELKPPISAAAWARPCSSAAPAGFWTASMESPRPAKVYLVGAGPGDPELITVKGRRILERADSILFDHLANERLLNLAPAHAERVYVGKKRSKHEFTQEEISQMLSERARRGWNVGRL